MLNLQENIQIYPKNKVVNLKEESLIFPKNKVVNLQENTHKCMYFLFGQLYIMTTLNTSEKWFKTFEYFLRPCGHPAVVGYSLLSSRKRRASLYPLWHISARTCGEEHRTSYIWSYSDIYSLFVFYMYFFTKYQYSIFKYNMCIAFQCFQQRVMEYNAIYFFNWISVLWFDFHLLKTKKLLKLS